MALHLSLSNYTFARVGITEGDVSPGRSSIATRDIRWRGVGRGSLQLFLRWRRHCGSGAVAGVIRFGENGNKIVRRYCARGHGACPWVRVGDEMDAEVRVWTHWSKSTPAARLSCNGSYYPAHLGRHPSRDGFTHPLRGNRRQGLLAMRAGGGVFAVLAFVVHLHRQT